MINFYEYYEGELDNRNVYAELLRLALLQRPYTKDQVTPILHIIKKSPRHAFRYAKHTLKMERWIEAEPYIMKHPMYALYYAHTIMKQKWPEAERYIMKDQYWWDQYIQLLRTGGIR